MDDVKSWFGDASIGGTSIAVEVRMSRGSVPFRVGSAVGQIISGALLTVFLSVHRRFAPEERDPLADVVDIEDHRRKSR